MATRASIVLTACVGLLLIATATTVAAPEKSDGKAEEKLEERLKEVLHERVRIAVRCRDATQAAFEAESVTLANLLDAMNALKDAELAVAVGPAQRLEVLQRHLDALRQTERKTQLLYNVGTKGGEAAKYAHAQRERLSAEAELLEEKIKQAR